VTAASDPVGHDPRRGRLIVLAGPSGVGKSSVVAGLRAALPDLYFSVSARPATRGQARSTAATTGSSARRVSTS